MILLGNGRKNKIIEKAYNVMNDSSFVLGNKKVVLNTNCSLRMEEKTMHFHLDTAEIYVSDNSPFEDMLARTTHLAIAAHQDDIEMMAAQPILECFGRDDKWFSGVVMTDGRGSPRAGKYQRYTDDEMSSMRTQEQFSAASIGKYAAQIVLGYPSSNIKDA